VTVMLLSAIFVIDIRI